MKLNKSVLIFGGTGGVGSELINKFINNGYNVIFTGTSFNKKKRFINKIDINNKLNLHFQKCNFEISSDIKKVIDFFFKSFPGDKIIIISSGVFFYDYLGKLNKKFINKIFNINLFSHMEINRLVSKYKNFKIKIINLGSSSSYHSPSNTILYSATKHALLSTIRSMNSIKKNNVKNILVSTGSIKTKMGSKIKQDYKTFISTKFISNIIFDIAEEDFISSIEEIIIKRKIS